MDTATTTTTDTLRMLAASAANTTWAIGTSTWSGLALLGKVLICQGDHGRKNLTPLAENSLSGSHGLRTTP